LSANFVKFGRQEVGKIVRYLLDKKKQNFASLSLLLGSRPKSTRTSGSQCTQSQNAIKFHPNWFTSGGVIAKRMNTIETCDKVNPILVEVTASCRVINKYNK